GEGKDDEFLHDWITTNFGKTGSWKDSIWRAPGDVVAPYAAADADRTLRLFDIRRPLITKEKLEDIYKIETALLPLVVKMHLTGVRVDQKKAFDVKSDMGKQLEIARQRW